MFGPFDYKIVPPAYIAWDTPSRVEYTLLTGCFDVLHYGHICLINDARSRWIRNKLVVGINSDESVGRIKPGRPILREHERAIMLASLAAVDYVCIFNESTPDVLISRIRPRIFVKGSDYEVEDLPEAETVRKYMGEVHILPLVPGWSTTEFIQKIKNIGT